jgi:hypothetical protein
MPSLWQYFSRVRSASAQPQCLHESIVMVARERDQGGVALHSTTRGYSVVPAVLGELTGIGWARKFRVATTQAANASRSGSASRTGGGGASTSAAGARGYELTRRFVAAAPPRS